MQGFWRDNRNWDLIGGDSGKTVSPPALSSVPKVRVRVLDTPCTFCIAGAAVEPGEVVEVSKHDLDHLVMAGKVEVL